MTFVFGQPGQEMAEDIVAEVEEHWTVWMPSAVCKHRQRKVIQAVVLQLQLLQVRQGDEGSPVDAGDLVVGEDEGDKVGQVPEGAHLNVAQSVPSQHDGLQLLKTGELAHSQEAEAVEGKSDISQVLVDVLVQQVSGDHGQLVGLEVEVLQLPQVVEARLADLPDLVVVEGEPEQLLQRFQGRLWENSHGEPEANFQTFKRASDVFEGEVVQKVEVVEG